MVLEIPVFNDEDAALAHFGRVGEYLATRVGRPFKVVVAPDYPTASVDLRRGDADLAYLPPLLGCSTLRWMPDVTYVASRVSTDGAFYEAVIVTAERGPIHTLEDARGVALGLVNEESAAGYLFPLAKILDLGLDPFTHFRKIYLLGTHKDAIRALARGSVAVAATHAEALSWWDENEIRVLARTDPIPSSSLMASPYLGDDLVQAIRAALLAPEYVTVVAGRPDLPMAYHDKGWQMLPPDVVDSPCRLAQRLKEARKRSRREGAP